MLILIVIIIVGVAFVVGGCAVLIVADGGTASIGIFLFCLLLGAFLVITGLNEIDDRNNREIAKDISATYAQVTPEEINGAGEELTYFAPNGRHKVLCRGRIYEREGRYYISPHAEAGPCVQALR